VAEFVGTALPVTAVVGSGIAPASVPAFVGAELVGLLVGVGLLATLYPHPGAAADLVVVPHNGAAAPPDRKAIGGSL
jgi:hypothetical protein